ncbi:MAG: hypothetical protein K0S65_364 [Labilithrix sp.]|nr:hypothetical protein [Labilithrix sp.]
MGCADGADPEPSAPIDGSSPIAEAGVDPDAAADGGTAVPACSEDGWCYTELPTLTRAEGDLLPDPNGVRLGLTAVWVAPEHQALAVSSAGHVLRWDGLEWRIDLVANAGLRSVWGGSATDVWLGGDSGLLLHGTGTPGSLAYQPVSLGTSQKITRIWGTSVSDVWVLADRVYHLEGETFVAVDVPSSFGSAAEYVRIAAVWGTATDTWFAGFEVSHCAPPSCMNVNQPYAARRKLGPGGNVTWDTIPMPMAGATSLVGGVSAGDGVQVVTLRTGLYDDTALAGWIADDKTKLGTGRGPITVAGAYAWSSEAAERYGQPEALWSTGQKDDVWLVGEHGVVRHFDGAAWRVVRVARTKLAPLVNHLHGIDGIVDPSGERDTWIVGDDVAIHRRAKP